MSFRLVRFLPWLVAACLGVFAVAWSYDQWQTGKEWDAFQMRVSDPGASPAQIASAATSLRTPASNIRHHVVMWSLGTGIVSLLVSVVAIGLVSARTQRQHEAIERPASQHAGQSLAEFLRDGGKLTAKATHSGMPQLYASSDQQIEIDAHDRTVLFRNFRFERSIGFPPLFSVCELAFEDILTARLVRQRFSASLLLRTTAGRVTVTNNFSSFRVLVALFSDIEDTNRLDRERYRAARAREPRIHVPRWLLAGASVTIVIVLLLFVQSL